MTQSKDAMWIPELVTLLFVTNKMPFLGEMQINKLDSKKKNTTCATFFYLVSIALFLSTFWGD